MYILKIKDIIHLKKRQLGLNTTRENIDKASAQYETKHFEDTKNV